nr:3-epi-6-deoxocathasterone 23-monooxygenase CYP90D1-like [Coffea arabica]
MYRRLTFKQLVEETMRLGNLSPLFSELGKGMLITKVKVHFFLISLLRDDGNLSREAYSLRVDEALDRIQNIQRMESCKLAKAHSHRITDPKNYEDALCFDPDRWNGQSNPGTFWAFGGGSRLCPGNMLARMQVAIFIHHFVSGCRWELVIANAGMRYHRHPIPVDGVEINISRI